MNQKQIRDYLLRNGTDWIKWHKNQAGAAHMGGVWERQIRSARSILAALLKTHGHSLNDEGLRKLVAETEAIINSRSLTVESLSYINSEIPLSLFLKKNLWPLFMDGAQLLKATATSRRQFIFYHSAYFLPISLP